MKWHVIICSVIVIGVLGFWFVQTQTSQENDSKLISGKVPPSQSDSDAKLVVGAQFDQETVRVKEVLLTMPGYVVVREVIDGTVGQIVEISPYLNAGTYSNIEIPLGDFYKGENELMVLLYVDAKNDKVLNDLDQPFVNSEGDFVARFVATDEIVPNVVIESEPFEVPMVMGGMSMQTVRYTNDGFSPSSLEVSVGSMVHFVNESDTEMWVASDPHPAHDILPTFDQFKPGDMYMYVFEKSGTWKYHDHLNAAVTGEIIVK